MGKKEDTSFEPGFGGVREPAVSTAELSGIEQKLGAHQRLRIQVPTANTLLQLGYKGGAENGFQAGISALTDEHVFITSRNSTVTVVGDAQVLLASQSGHLFAQANESTFVGAGNKASMVGAGGAFVGGGVDWSPAAIDETASAPSEQAYPGMSDVASAAAAAASTANTIATGASAVVYAAGIEWNVPGDVAAAAATGWAAAGAPGLSYPGGGETTVYGRGQVVNVTDGVNLSMGFKSSLLAQVKAMIAAPMVTAAGLKAELVSITKSTLLGGVKTAVVSGAKTEVASRRGTTELLGHEIEMGTKHGHATQVGTSEIKAEASKKIELDSDDEMRLLSKNMVQIKVGPWIVQVSKDGGVWIRGKGGDPEMKMTDDKVSVSAKKIELAGGGTTSGTMTLDSKGVSGCETVDIGNGTIQARSGKVMLG